MSLVKRNVISSVILVLLVAGFIWLWPNRHIVRDWITAQQYTPTSEVASIATDIDLTQNGKLLFYASRPEITDAAEFNERCDRREDGTAIIGCYGEGKIFLYRINNESLNGIEQVTAAHELLHAAWERLSEGDRTRISAELEDVYNRVKDTKLEERMSYYERQQPGSRANELHSILGTENKVLSVSLEEHYKDYFNDRQTIVKLYDGYEAVFADLDAKATRLKNELENEAPRINREVARLNSEVEALNKAIIQHNQVLSTIDRRSSAAVNDFNARRSFLLSEQERLNREKAFIDARRRLFDKKLDEYNSLVVRTTTLTDSIDSLKAHTDIK